MNLTLKTLHERNRQLEKEIELAVMRYFADTCLTPKIKVKCIGGKKPTVDVFVKVVI